MNQGDDYEEMDEFLQDPHYYLKVIEEEQVEQNVRPRVRRSKPFHYCFALITVTNYCSKVEFRTTCMKKQT